MNKTAGQGLPGVGVGVFIFKDGKVLFGRRLSALAPNTWCPPGGKLEHSESWEACAKRETLEEAGLKIKNVQVVGVTNDIFTATGQHFITIHVRADWASGTPIINEPDKITDWQWVTLEDLPKPLFLSVENLLKSQFRAGLTV